MNPAPFVDSDFDDIRPYRDEELIRVIDRLSKDPWTVRTVRRFLLPQAHFLIVPFIELCIRLYLNFKVMRVHTVDDFHYRFMRKPVLQWIRRRTMTSLTWSNFHYASKEKRSIYMTNHRDITLDSAFLCYILMLNKITTPEIAFGDNLLMNELVSTIIRINKGFIVKRNLPMREQLRQSLHLSNYIWYTLTNNRSIWLAQRGGRAKDGDDRTEPSIIKMLYLSQRKGGESFSEFINWCNIIPVAISYELDPCDEIKAREVFSVRTTGEYEKGEREDLISILRGINFPKGRVNYSFCPPLYGEWETAKQVAEEIDRRIILNYHNWPTNYISYDLMFETDKYADKYTAIEKEKFISRFSKLKDDIYKTVLEIYARSIINREAITEE